jgi:hypothetical protein
LNFDYEKPHARDCERMWRNEAENSWFVDRRGRILVIRAAFVRLTYRCRKFVASVALSPEAAAGWPPRASG